MKNLNERATLFKITSNAMINACTEFMELTQTQGRYLLILLASHRGKQEASVVQETPELNMTRCHENLTMVRRMPKN